MRAGESDKETKASLGLPNAKREINIDRDLFFFFGSHLSLDQHRNGDGS